METPTDRCVVTQITICGFIRDESIIVRWLVYLWPIIARETIGNSCE